MADVVIRIDPDAEADTASLMAAITGRLGGLSGVIELEVATATGEGERIDLDTIQHGLGAVTIILGTTQLTVTGARKLLEEVRDALGALVGIKQASLELVGRTSLPLVVNHAPASIKEADAEAVAEETAL